MWAHFPTIENPGGPGARGRLAPHPLPIPLGLLAWETPAPTTLLCVVAPSPPLPRHVTNPGRGPPTGSSQLGEGASPGSHRQPPGSRPAGPRESCEPTPGRSGEPARSEAGDSRDASPAKDLYVLSLEWSSSFQPVSPHPSWQAFFPLQNPVALDFLDVLSRFSNLVFTYFLILVYKDYFDQSCTELLAGLSPVLWVLRSSKDYKAGGRGGGGRPTTL